MSSKSDDSTEHRKSSRDDDEKEPLLCRPTYGQIGEKEWQGEGIVGEACGGKRVIACSGARSSPIWSMMS